MTIATVGPLKSYHRGDIAFVCGTWDADGDPIKMDIDTGGSLVLAVSVTNSKKVAASPKIKYNNDLAGPNNGHLTLKPENGTDLGDWWAIIEK